MVQRETASNCHDGYRAKQSYGCACAVIYLTASGVFISVALRRNSSSFAGIANVDGAIHGDSFRNTGGALRHHVVGGRVRKRSTNASIGRSGC